MANFWRNRWDDIRGSLLWQIILWVAGGGFATVIAAVVRSYRQSPFNWSVLLAVFLISALLLAVVTLLAGRNRPSPQSTVQSAPIIPVQPTTTPFDPKEFFRTAYTSSLTDEAEKNIRLAASVHYPNDREGFLARMIGIGAASYLYDLCWANIYRSQVLMLTELNRRNGLMPLADAKPFYDRAVVEYAHYYTNYSFDRWLAFVKGQGLILQHPSDMLEITVRGKDFLKYLTHWGRDASDRRG